MRVRHHASQGLFCWTAAIVLFVALLAGCSTGSSSSSPALPTLNFVGSGGYTLAPGGERDIFIHIDGRASNLALVVEHGGTAVAGTEYELGDMRLYESGGHHFFIIPVTCLDDARDNRTLELGFLGVYGAVAGDNNTYTIHFESAPDA